MKSTLKWALVPALTALLIPYRANALALGDIKLDSYLNQPLDAQIRVLPDEVGQLGEVHMGLASKRAYEKAGIERRMPPDFIKFKIVKDKDGIPAIRLTSQAPIKEPLLDFILEVTWPNGRILREYTVFLNPPAAVVSGEKVMGGQAVPQRQSTAAAPSPPIATRSIVPKLTRGSYGPTMRPDTLWPIAKAVRPDDSVSIEQVMLALVKKNPEAFYNDNVNELKAGYMLRIPGKDLIKQVSEADAARQVKQQYRRWLQSKKGERPAAGATRETGPGGGQDRAMQGGAVTATVSGTAPAPSGPPDKLVQAD